MLFFGEFNYDVFVDIFNVVFVGVFEGFKIVFI